MLTNQSYHQFQSFIINKMYAVQPSIYMRFHTTLEKAITFIKDLYADKKSQYSNELKIQRCIRVAGLTEEIEIQDYIDYHMTWLVGVLYEAKQFNQIKYEQNINSILSDLAEEQIVRVQKYINQLSHSVQKSKGQQYQQMLQRMQTMDIIPTYIRIFDIYDICLMAERQQIYPKQIFSGLCCYAYLVWYRAIYKDSSIVKNIKSYIKDFFVSIQKAEGGIKQIRNKVKIIYNQLK